MKLLVQAISIVDAGKAGSFPPERLLVRVREQIGVFLQRPGFRLRWPMLEEIRSDAKTLSGPMVQARALAALRGVVESQRGGVLIRETWSRRPSGPRPVDWPASSQWPPAGTSDAFDGWRELRALAGEQGPFAIEGLVTARQSSPMQGAQIEVVIDTTHVIGKPWKPAMRLLLLLASALAVALAAWWPPSLQRRLCGQTWRRYQGAPSP